GGGAADHPTAAVVGPVAAGAHPEVDPEHVARLQSAVARAAEHAVVGVGAGGGADEAQQVGAALQRGAVGDGGELALAPALARTGEGGDQADRGGAAGAAE